MFLRKRVIPLFLVRGVVLRGVVGSRNIRPSIKRSRIYAWREGKFREQESPHGGWSR